MSNELADDATGVLLDDVPPDQALPWDSFPEDPIPDDPFLGERIVRDGMLVRLVPDDAVPVLPDDLPLPDAMPVWPPAAPVDPDVPGGRVWPLLDAPKGSPTGVATGAPKEAPAAAPTGALTGALTGAPTGAPPGVPDVPSRNDMLRQALTGRPGAELARVVAEATNVHTDLLADLPDDVLGDIVAACGRLQSWAAGMQARAVAERAARETNPLAHASLVGQVTSELVVTGTEASEVVVRAESGTQHPTVLSALESGRIDVRKAQTLLRSATQLTVAERAEAIARYLPQAPARTWRWLRTRMLAFAKSRHGAGEAERAAAQHRNVQLDRAENDMGWLSAYLPAVDAAAVWGVVDDLARQLRRTTGEDRDLGQLRADCLTGIVTGRLLPADRFADRTGDASAEHDSAGPSSHANSTDTGHDTDGGPVCTCGGRAPVVQEVVRVTPTRPVVRVTVPASALLGLDDAPGDLEGFGPVTADLAARIAGDATWQRLVTDPVTGVLTDYSTPTYRPASVLRQAVVARDRTCAFPHCEHPADWDDLDHIVAFDHDPKSRTPGTPGQTRADNLQPLCRRHHLLKTHAGWGVVRDAASGVTTWTAPTGLTHARPPTVLDTRVEIDEVDPDTSYDLTRRALTGRRLPRAYRKTGRDPRPGRTGATRATDTTTGTGAITDSPPF